MLGMTDLTWMRSAQNSILPGTVTIQRVTLTPDGMGGFTETWSNVGTVAGRLYPVNSRAFAESDSGAQLVSQTRWFVTLPVGTIVTAADRLVVGNRLFHITQVNNSEMWQTAVRCEVSAVNEETVDLNPGFAHVFDFSLTTQSQYVALL